MAMGGIFTKADVGNDEEGRESSTKEAYGLYDWTLWVICCGTQSVFDIWCNGHAEEYYGAKTFPDKGFKVGYKLVDAATVLVGE